MPSGREFRRHEAAHKDRYMSPGLLWGSQVNPSESHTTDVELTDVTKAFGSVMAVDHVSLKVRKGEFFSLLGPSGCGKTTTLRIIAGFEEPDSGTVTLRGQVVNDVPPYKRGIGMVFQNLALFPHMNVFQNLSFGLKMMRMPAGKVAGAVSEMLEVVDLPGVQERRIDQLSGGQQQRVALARALITEPTVLLLDEPLGALDLKLRIQMQVELKRVHAKVGTTFVYVTHDQGEALAMSDRVGVMHRGRIQQIGSPIEIYQSPGNSFVADFIGETNLLKGTLKEPSLAVVGKLTFNVNGERGMVNKPVFLSVRPEKVQISKEDLDLPNSFAGTLEDLTFKGAIMEARVRVDGIVLRAEVSPSLGTNFEVGQGVRVGWNTGDMLVLEG